jgi:nucleoside-triphosphatase THEP1
LCFCEHNDWPKKGRTAVRRRPKKPHWPAIPQPEVLRLAGEFRGVNPNQEGPYAPECGSQRMGIAKITLISGTRGQGKTTFLRAHLAVAAREGCLIGGIASPAVEQDGELLGYDLIDLRSGTRRPLARVAPDAPREETFGRRRFRFDTQALAEGNQAIISAVADGVGIIAIDEVGPLEFTGGGWYEGLVYALANCSPDQQLILVVRPKLVDKLPTRFSSAAWAHARRVAPPWPEPGTI